MIEKKVKKRRECPVSLNKQRLTPNAISRKGQSQCVHGIISSALLQLVLDSGDSLRGPNVGVVHLCGKLQTRQGLSEVRL
jgi:hypothetical protein